MKNKHFISGTLAFFAAALLLVSCADPIMPTPDFTFEIDDKTVTFTNTSMDATSYSWDFGDESDAVTTEDASHTYDAYGDYDVRLTATNDDGEEIKKTTISVVKEWPAITIDGTFTDWAEVESLYSGFGAASGTLTEAKVTTDAAGSKLYIYLKGTMNAAYPVVQVMIDADGVSTTGWDTPDDYATNGAEYQFEYYAVDQWGGVYSWGSDQDQGWPWETDITADPDNGDITESSGVIAESEIEFVIETSLMKNPVLADVIGIYFWAQPEDWSVTSGFLPPIYADPLESVKTFSFQ